MGPFCLEVEGFLPLCIAPASSCYLYHCHWWRVSWVLCRRTAISFVCSTWDLPVLCPPLLGLHTLETGVRCAAGDCVSPLGHVAVVASSSRCALPDGSIGNIWVASGGPAHPVTRGMHAVPLQWIFDPSRNERQGPYKVTGARHHTPAALWICW